MTRSREQLLPDTVFPFSGTPARTASHWESKLIEEDAPHIRDHQEVDESHDFEACYRKDYVGEGQQALRI